MVKFIQKVIYKFIYEIININFDIIIFWINILFYNKNFIRYIGKNRQNVN